MPASLLRLPGAEMAETSFPKSGGGLEPHAMKAALVWLLLLAAPPTVVPATDPAHPKPEHLVGLWHSRTRLSEGTVTIQRDGTFRYRPYSEPRTITGLWRLQGGAIV
jgi:hypothetical protein